MAFSRAAMALGLTPAISLNCSGLWKLTENLRESSPAAMTSLRSSGVAREPWVVRKTYGIPTSRLSQDMASTRRVGAMKDSPIKKTPISLTPQWYISAVMRRKSSMSMSLVGCFWREDSPQNLHLQITFSSDPDFD